MCAAVMAGGRVVGAGAAAGNCFAQQVLSSDSGQSHHWPFCLPAVQTAGSTGSIG